MTVVLSPHITLVRPHHTGFGQGLLEPLLDLARYANDATRLSALAALELIALNLPQAADRIEALGGADLREGTLAAFQL